MEKLLCIYHGNCADGFTAAWAVRKALGEANVDFHAASYGDPVRPDVTNRNVLLVDFSYKRTELEAMACGARAIVVLDHHKTAAEDLAGFEQPAPWSANLFAEIENAAAMSGGLPIRALFDMERSGAAIAWDFFHGMDRPRPMLVEFVQDRDLWRFNLGGTRQVQACIFSHGYDFETWDWLSHRIEIPASLQELIAEGRAIERKHHKDIEELLPVTTRSMRIGGFDVPVANLPYIFSSDAASKLAENAPFGACYYDGPNGRIFSLRSRGEGAIDVAAIAATYGGGGHKNASGFQMQLGWEGDAT